VPAAGVQISALLAPEVRDPAVSDSDTQATLGGLSSYGLHELPAACATPCPVPCCRSERRSCWQPSSPKASCRAAFASLHMHVLLCCFHQVFNQCQVFCCGRNCAMRGALQSILTCTAPKSGSLCRAPGGAGGSRLAGGQRTSRGALPRSSCSRACSRQPPAALDVRRQPGQGAVGWQLSQRCRGPHGKLPPARPAGAAFER
jgi:hypothetical protein